MKKKLSGIKFRNGAKMNCYYHNDPQSDEPTDLLEIETISQKGESTEWFFNIYDLANLIWLLSEAQLHAIELNLPLRPADMDKTLKLPKYKKPQDYDNPLHAVGFNHAIDVVKHKNKS